MTAGAGTAGAASKPAHRDPNVLRWVSAYALSMVGDSACLLALGWAARDVAGPAQVGAVMATAAVPRALLMLGGGVVADRFGIRRVVVGSDAVRCVLVFAAALAFGEPGLWPLVASALLYGVVDALFLPAVGTLPPRLTSPGQFARVQGMRVLAVRVGTVTGPPLGGLAMGLGGTAAAFAVAGVLFALCVPLLVTVRMRPLPVAARHPAGSTTARRDLADGLRYVRRHPLVGPLLLSGALSELGVIGPLNVGLLLLADARGWGAGGMAAIVVAFGAGAGAGALLLAVRGRLPRAGAVQIGALVVSSAAIGAIGVSPTLPVAVALGVTSGLVGGVCGGLAQALVQTSTAPAYLGRATSVMSLTALGVAPLTYPLFGAAVQAWGVEAVFAGSAVLSALGAVVTLASPAVRRAELPRIRTESDVRQSDARQSDARQS